MLNFHDHYSVVSVDEDFFDKHYFVSDSRIVSYQLLPKDVYGFPVLSLDFLSQLKFPEDVSFSKKNFERRFTYALAFDSFDYFIKSLKIDSLDDISLDALKDKSFGTVFSKHTLDPVGFFF